MNSTRCHVALQSAADSQPPMTMRDFAPVTWHRDASFVRAIGATRPVRAPCSWRLRARNPPAEDSGSSEPRPVRRAHGRNGERALPVRASPMTQALLKEVDHRLEHH